MNSPIDSGWQSIRKQFLRHLSWWVALAWGHFETGEVSRDRERLASWHWRSKIFSSRWHRQWCFLKSIEYIHICLRDLYMEFAFRIIQVGWSRMFCFWRIIDQRYQILQLFGLSFGGFAKLGMWSRLVWSLENVSTLKGVELPEVQDVCQPDNVGWLMVEWGSGHWLVAYCLLVRCEVGIWNTCQVYLIACNDFRSGHLFFPQTHIGKHKSRIQFDAAFVNQ